MADFFLSPNMSLVIPTPTVAPGPDWASDLNASLTIIDSHNHTPGSGVAINPAAININSDLPFNTHNATQLRSVRFQPNAAALSLPSDIGAIYEAGIDLYYNDGAGNQIRLTQAGSIVGTAGSITGLPSGTASAAYIAVSGTFQFQQATNTAANIDVASVIIRYPGSYPTPTGNFIILEAPSSLASGYALVLPALPAQTNVMTLSPSGVIASITYNQVGQNMSSVGANAIGVSMTATGADAIGVSMTSTGANAVANDRTRAVGTPAGLGGIALSAAITSAITTNTTYNTTGISALSVTLTTNGRPVFVGLITDNTTSAIEAFFNVSRTTAPWTATASIRIRRSSTTIASVNIGGTAGPDAALLKFLTPPALQSIDYTANTPGTYTYSVEWKTDGAGISLQIGFVRLVAYEL